MSTGVMDSLELPGWAIDSPIRNADSPIEVSDENERVPHLPSDTVMAPPTGQLPSAPFYFGGALSNKIQVIEDPPERHVRAAFKFWAVYELLPSGAGLAEIWVFTRVCQSIYLRPANATPSLYRSLIQGYWMPWNRFYSGVWGQLHSVRARLVPRVDYIRLDGTYKLFDRTKLELIVPSTNRSTFTITWEPNAEYLEGAMLGDAEYQPMVSEPTFDELREWFDENRNSK